MSNFLIGSFFPNETFSNKLNYDRGILMLLPERAIYESERNRGIRMIALSVFALLFIFAVYCFRDS